MTVTVKGLKANQTAVIEQVRDQIENLGKVTASTVQFNVTHAWEAADALDKPLETLVKGGGRQEVQSVQRRLRDPQFAHTVTMTHTVETPNTPAVQEDSVATIEQAVAESEAVSTFEEARSRADNIKRGLDDFAGVTIPAIQTAWRRQDHKALEYDSWESYVEKEYGAQLARLGRDQSREMIAVLSGYGMSSRAIAPIVGVSKDTVSREQRKSGVSNDTGATGLDGKTYTKKPKKDPNVEDAVTVPLVACAVCAKERPAEQMTELDDGPTCNSCVDAADLAEDRGTSDSSVKLDKALKAMNSAVTQAVSAMPLNGVTAVQATDFLRTWAALNKKTTELRAALKQVQVDYRDSLTATSNKIKKEDSE